MNGNVLPRHIGRQLSLLAVFWVISAIPVPAKAQDAPTSSEQATRSPDPYHELETKYIFGFTEGADIGEEGERAIDLETTTGFRKRGGRYNMVEQELEWEQIPSQYWGYELSAHFAHFDVKGVEGLDDVNRFDFNGLSSEFRYLVIGRGPGAPVGLTLTATPEWGRIDDGGHSVIDFSTAFKVVADTEVIPNRLYMAGNLIYVPDVAKSPGGNWQPSSTFGATGALAFRFAPKITAGGEIEYYRVSDGLDFHAFQGQALYLGPILHIQWSNKIMLAAAFSSEIAGRATGDDRNLDLTNFSRYRANLKMEFEF